MQDRQKGGGAVDGFDDTGGLILAHDCRTVYLVCDRGALAVTEELEQHAFCAVLVVTDQALQQAGREQFQESTQGATSVHSNTELFREGKFSCVPTWLNLQKTSMQYSWKIWA
jgi:hypothetical protein